MRLTMDQVVRFQTDGFVVAENVLTDADLQPVIDELELIIDTRATLLYEQGKITQLYEKEPFEERLIYLHAQCPEIEHQFDVMYLFGEAFFRFLHNDNLLDVVECFLGEEISCNPIQHVRAKKPMKENETINYNENVLWHQDAGVIQQEADISDIITFWVPLIDATAETGCMQLMPEVFKQGILPHQTKPAIGIQPDSIPDVEPVLAECRKGGIVIMNKFTPHAGTFNHSNRIRWSLDLRFHKSGAHSGRSFYPSFPVRSRRGPGNVMNDHARWRQMWEQALTRKEIRQWNRFSEPVFS